MYRVFLEYSKDQKDQVPELLYYEKAFLQNIVENIKMVLKLNLRIFFLIIYVIQNNKGPILLT